MEIVFPLIEGNEGRSVAALLEYLAARLHGANPFLESTLVGAGAP